MQDTTREDNQNTRIICNSTETTEHKNYKQHLNTEEINKRTMNTYQCNRPYNKHKRHDYSLGT
jgi:hypothetical protein